jgi:uncharacterized protein YbjT (DUF2867 family)
MKGDQPGKEPNVRILVTGGTGHLGRQVVSRLLTHEVDLRVLSRHAHPATDHEWATGDLRSGDGVDDAVADVDVIVHCATAFSHAGEVRLAENLVRAAKQAGRQPHLVYISIVGIDRIGLGYYQGKLDTERLLANSGLPHTIQRATQFHTLLDTVFSRAAQLPVLPIPDLRFQPIDAGEVADRLVELAVGEPLGRVDDIGGPQVRTARDLAGAYLHAVERRRSILPIRLPGRTFRAFRAGGNLTPDHAIGTITFEQYLAERGRA